MLDMRCICTLSLSRLAAYRDHLLRLSGPDRRSRFGIPMDDAAIERHVAGLDLRRDRILVCLDDDLQVVGAVHMAPRDSTVEFAFSVDCQCRGQGLAQALMDRATLWARNRGLRQVLMLCAGHNQTMRHIAAKAGMAVENSAGESEGALPLPLPSPMTWLAELVAESRALYDTALKEERSTRQLWTRQLWTRPLFPLLRVA